MKAELDSLELRPILNHTAAGTGDAKAATKLLESLRDIQGRVAAMPVLDPRPADELLGYNEHGVFD